MNISFLSSPLSKHIMLTYLISHWLSVAAMARVNVRRRSLAPTATCVKQARLHSRSTQLVELDCLKKNCFVVFSLSLSLVSSLLSRVSLSHLLPVCNVGSVGCPCNGQDSCGADASCDTSNHVCLRKLSVSMASRHNTALTVVSWSIMAVLVAIAVGDD